MFLEIVVSVAVSFVLCWGGAKPISTSGIRARLCQGSSAHCEQQIVEMWRCEADWSRTKLLGGKDQRIISLSTMANLANETEGLEKRNNHSYDLWWICMESHLQGQHLWEVVGSNEIVPLAWRMPRPCISKPERLIFGIQTMAQKKMLQHIQEADTLKTA